MPKTRRRPRSAAQKKQISASMKAYWAKRRQGAKSLSAAATALTPAVRRDMLQHFNGTALLGARSETHGDFRKNAQISQELKTVMREAGQLGLSAAHAEALDMIALKLSRILGGKATEPEHWIDLAGYSKLAELACSDEPA